MRILPDLLHACPLIGVKTHSKALDSIRKLTCRTTSASAVRFEKSFPWHQEQNAGFPSPSVPYRAVLPVPPLSHSRADRHLYIRQTPAREAPVSIRRAEMRFPGLSQQALDDVPCSFFMLSASEAYRYQSSGATCWRRIHLGDLTSTIDETELPAGDTLLLTSRDGVCES